MGAEWKSLRVDIGAIIRDFVEAYPYEPFEIMVIESIANSLDAKSSKISITLKPKGDELVFTIIDNGKGMNQEEFEANYHALAISSKSKGEGIGFAGIDAKLYLIYLPQGKTILTETRKEGKALTSHLALIYGEPRWTYDNPSILTHDGTLYEVTINPEHSKDLNEKVLLDIIQRHFNSVLLGISTNKCEIEVNGKRVTSWRPSLVEEHNFSLSIAGKTCTGIFWYSQGEIDRLPGIEISVYGKTIQNDWFGLDYSIRSQARQKITGHIVADPLTSLLNVSKSAFKPSSNPSLWTNFRKAA